MNYIKVLIYFLLILFVIVGLLYNTPVQAVTNTYCNTYGNVSSCDSYNETGHTERTDTSYNYNPKTTEEGASSSYTYINPTNETY